MNKTKTGKSKTNDLYELITGLDEAEANQFKKMLSKSGEEEGTVYLAFFNYMRGMVEEGKLLEQIFEDQIRVDVVERQQISKNYQSLCRNLHRKLLEFLASQYRMKDSVVWRQQVTQGLDEVEALSSRHYFKQAAARLAQVEKLVPAFPERYVWNDLLPIARLSALKFWLKDKVNFLRLTNDENTIRQLSRLAEYFKTDFSRNGEKSLFEVLNMEGDKMFLFRMLNGMIVTKNADAKQLKLLSSILKRYRSKEGLSAIMKKFSKDIPNQTLKTRLINAYILRLSLRKIGLLLDMGSIDDAYKEMDRFLKSTEGEINKGVLLLLTAQRQELGLSRAINGSKDKAKISFQAQYTYSENVIEDLPMRIEVNSVLCQAFNGNYDEAFRRVTTLLKHRAGRNARKSLIIELKLLECVLKIELTTSRIDFDYESLRRLNDAVKNHDGTTFERLASKVINGLGGWAGDRYHQQWWLSQPENESLLKSMKDATNISNPLHQFVIHWLGIIQDWKQGY